LYFADWSDNKKTILLNEYQKRSIVAAATSSLLSGGYLLNTLWGGAGTYYELAIVPAIFCFSNEMLKNNC
jgi:hypothetical protein